MSVRMMKVRDGTMSENWEDLWEVLTPDLREQEFTGTHEECAQYLRNQCPNGSCEE